MHSYSSHPSPVAGVGVSEASFRDLSSDPFLEAQARIESNARSYPRRIPLTVSRAYGVRVEDSRGQRFLDSLACAGALPLGHNHPEVNQAVFAYMQDGGPLQALDLMTPAKGAFLEALLGALPPHWRDDYRVQFCGPGGADAVEASVKLVKYATGRENIMSFHGAYHGMSQFSLGMTGNLGAKGRLPGIGGIHFLPYPSVFRSPFGASEDEVAVNNYRYIQNLLRDPESGIARPAGLILEVVQGEGGVNPAPLGWLRRVRELTRSLGIPLIIDEVQTGLGRTGAMFAFQYAGIEPDALVLSKAIGGSFPMSVVVYRKDLDVWPSGAHAGTFRGNQIAMVAGAKTIEIIQRDGLVLRAQECGAYFMGELRRLQERFPFVGDVRGRGLMIGVEIVSPDGALDENDLPLPSGETARRIQRAALRRGLILELGGRFSCVLRFLPPLIIEQNELAELVSILEDSFAAVAAGEGAE